MGPTAKRSRLQAWLREGAQQNATHMFLVFDALDDDVFPIFLHPGIAPTRALENLTVGEQRLVQCFRVDRPLEAQLDRTHTTHAPMGARPDMHSE